ncbi:bifunctional adenosylcobinamide kinase/adenosylcobinamide-phosphate guanylyltransferase [Shimia sp. MMG029]|uniref:bifunctional adenosylcobinamide kinase/adenosylcobinamide-phosphate guanylyltransferase n=1 Tax=Shimia sp. MMG029 TaxID=3021978 RepID=UPI0022FE2FB4|nr:bifunctional adenosylcobinamide kinase/adenosylcobinamide-phosphate guanylyltransferase [Shimia sp. MMG029]MDA5558414.1 bifunctional adenosylcobinamide kinase/adenosylcobinamide-phosphate guanylyltransferase [Shimia sp. MMG029]
MLPKLSLILGGAASGKSVFAEKLVVSTGQPRMYLATAQAFDAEMEAKVEKHLVQRGPDWQTIESPLETAQALLNLPANAVVLLDCATMWLSNHLMAENDLATEQDNLLTALRNCHASVVVVSNEVGLDVVPENKLARQFRNAQGALNQALAHQADLAVLVVAGLPMVLKGQLP